MKRALLEWLLSTALIAGKLLLAIRWAFTSDEDIAGSYVEPGALAGLSQIAGGQRLARCVLAVYRADTNTPPAIAPGFEPWSAEPLDGRVHPEGLQMRALWNADGCWDNDVIAETGSPRLDDYIADRKPLISFQHNNMALFEPDRRLLVVFEG